MCCLNNWTMCATCAILHGVERRPGRIFDRKRFWCSCTHTNKTHDMRTYTDISTNAASVSKHGGQQRWRKPLQSPSPTPLAARGPEVSGPCPPVLPRARDSYARFSGRAAPRRTCTGRGACPGFPVPRKGRGACPGSPCRPSAGLLGAPAWLTVEAPARPRPLEPAISLDAVKSAISATSG